MSWLSESQKEDLKKRSRGTTESQWYTIWDVVFPGQPRPLSPYIDESLSEDFSSFLEFFHNTDHGLFPQPGDLGYFTAGADVEHHLRICFGRVYNQWAASRGYSASMVQAIDFAANATPPGQTHVESRVEDVETTAIDGGDGHDFASSDANQPDADFLPGSEFLNLEGYN
jgi:hypothetical protein